MSVKVYFNDNTSTEIPEEALSNMERLLHDKISKVEYLQDNMEFVNNLAKQQLAEMEAREKAQKEAALKAEQAKDNGQKTSATTSTAPKKPGRKPKQ